MAAQRHAALGGPSRHVGWAHLGRARGHAAAHARAGSGPRRGAPPARAPRTGAHGRRRAPAAPARRHRRTRHRRTRPRARPHAAPPRRAGALWRNARPLPPPHQLFHPLRRPRARAHTHTHTHTHKHTHAHTRTHAHAHTHAHTGLRTAQGSRRRGLGGARGCWRQKSPSVKCPNGSREALLRTDCRPNRGIPRHEMLKNEKKIRARADKKQQRGSKRADANPQWKHLNMRFVL